VWLTKERDEARHNLGIIEDEVRVQSVKVTRVKGGQSAQTAEYNWRIRVK